MGQRSPADASHATVIDVSSDKTQKEKKMEIKWATYMWLKTSPLPFTDEATQEMFLIISDID